MNIPGHFNFENVGSRICAWQGVWTYEDLNTFLFAPMATTPGVAMADRGTPDETKRANLIAYLRSLSD